MPANLDKAVSLDATTQEKRKNLQKIDYRVNKGVEEMKEEMISLRQELSRLRNMVNPLTAISDLTLK